MKIERTLQAAVVLACLTAAGTTLAQGDAEAGKSKARACMGCHGIPGYSNSYPNYQVPKLAGQHAEYIVTALTAYKEGARQHTTMHAQAADLSDEDMANIAAYFSSAGK